MSFNFFFPVILISCNRGLTLISSGWIQANQEVRGPVFLERSQAKNIYRCQIKISKTRLKKI